MSEVVVSLFHVRDERTVQSRIEEAVEDYSRTYKTEDSQVKLLYESGGKPYLESRAVELSISHSGELWGCALSKEPVGLDIQLIREKGVCSVAKRFFHPEEYRYLQETGFSDFFSLWTAKESYVKFTGEGITDGFSAFSVVDSQGLLSSVNGLNESAASSLEINGRSGKTLLFYIMDAQGAGGLYRGGKLAFYFPAVKNSA